MFSCHASVSARRVAQRFLFQTRLSAAGPVCGLLCSNSSRSHNSGHSASGWSGTLFSQSCRSQSRGLSSSTQVCAAVPGPSSDDHPPRSPEAGPPGLLERWFGWESNIAVREPPSRLLMILPAFATHLCIGAPYAWSVVGSTLVREQGVVASAAADWSLGEATIPLSLAFAMQGIMAALAGKWQLRAGPRKSVALGSLLYGGGLLLGAAGIGTHQLWMLYLGYGIVAGAGVGIGYTPPVQMLMQWFPTRRGMASGMTIAGFGSAALVFGPAMSKLMSTFQRAPEYVGTADAVAVALQDGRLMADVGGAAREVVYAGATDLAQLSGALCELPEGYYAVGSGSTGAAAALGVMGAAYFTVLLSAALGTKIPQSVAARVSNVSPNTSTSPDPAPPTAAPSKQLEAAPEASLSVDQAMRMPQFYFLTTTFFCMATGGVAMLSVAKTMMGDVFSGSLPMLVTASFASAYVMMLAVGNLGGRLGWAVVFDRLGPKKTFLMFTLGSLPLYLMVPQSIQWVVESPSALPLGLFVASTTLAVSGMGATYALLPAFEAKLFGPDNVSAIHGRILLGSSIACLAGPSIIIYLRSLSEKSYMGDMLSKVNPDSFQHTFGVPLSQAQALIDAHTLTLTKLAAIMPGTVDPTPFLYNSTMYTMAGLMGVAGLSIAAIRDIDRKHFVTKAKQE
eukprot:m.252260 g.252260  ORF g.252260 m.252260 type:complete len:678 (-) comp22659_c0_seq1:189-2222(-)